MNGLTYLLIIAAVLICFGGGTIADVFYYIQQGHRIGKAIEMARNEL